MQALTMRELRKYNVDIACLSEIKIPDSGHSVIKVPGEEACHHFYHRGEVDKTESMAWQLGLQQALNIIRVMQWFKLAFA